MSSEEKKAALPRQRIENQLEKILISDVFAGGGAFKRAERLADLLRHMVTETLNGNRVTENSLLLDFYKLKPSEMTGNGIARTSVRRLRAKLAKYHNTAGLNDPLVIEVLVGGYVPTFRDNLNSPNQKEVKLGFLHVDRESPADIAFALEHFDNAISLDPENADAYAGKASALLTQTLHAYENDPTKLFEQAEEAAKHARDLDKSCWRAHANLGAVYLFRHEWDKATAAFNEARRLSPQEIDTIGGYGPYLLSVGLHKNAEELARRYLEDGFDDKILLGRAGLYFYTLRLFDEAENALQSSLRIDPYFWRTHLLMALTFLGLKQPELALTHMRQVTPLSGMNLWPGLKIFCLEAAGRSEEAQADFEKLKKASDERYIQPMQLALAHLALGDAVDAISFLSLACDEFDPFTAWLRLWPILDPLRRFPEFRTLLRRWDFPTSSEH